MYGEHRIQKVRLADILLGEKKIKPITLDPTIRQRLSQFIPTENKISQVVIKKISNVTDWFKQYVSLEKPVNCAIYNGNDIIKSLRLPYYFPTRDWRPKTVSPVVRNTRPTAYQFNGVLGGYTTIPCSSYEGRLIHSS